MKNIRIAKLNDLPLFETIKYIDSVIAEYREELQLPENSDIRSRIWDAMQQCIELRKELCNLCDINIILEDKGESQHDKV